MIQAVIFSRDNMSKKPDIYLVKRGNSLVAEDRLAFDAIERFAEGKMLQVLIHNPRSLKQLRFFRAFIKLVWQGQTEPQIYATEDDLIDGLKMATGHVKKVINPNGHTTWAPASIDFASMNQEAFHQWMDNAIKVVLERILPHLMRGDLETEIYHMLGERGPND